MGGSGGARGRPPRRPPGCARARPAATALPHYRSTTGGTGRRARAFGRAHHPLNGNSGGRGRRGLRPRLPEFVCGWARLAEFQGAGPPSAQTRASGPGHRIIEGGARSSGTLGAFSKSFSNHPIRPSLTLGYIQHLADPSPISRGLDFLYSAPRGSLADLSRGISRLAELPRASLVSSRLADIIPRLASPQAYLHHLAASRWEPK